MLETQVQSTMKTNIYSFNRPCERYNHCLIPLCVRILNVNNVPHSQQWGVLFLFMLSIVWGKYNFIWNNNLTFWEKKAYEISILPNFAVLLPQMFLFSVFSTETVLLHFVEICLFTLFLRVDKKMSQSHVYTEQALGDILAYFSIITENRGK